MPGTVGSIETSTISCTDCLSTFSMSRRERNVRVQEVQLDASWLHQSPLHRPSSSKKQLQLSSSIVINVKARAGARLRRSVDPMQQFVCLPYQLMRSAVGVIVVLAQLQNHCRSRETCSFGTPDAVVCKAARSASAVLAAVGRSVGIAARAGGWIWVRKRRLIATKSGELAPLRLPVPHCTRHCMKWSSCSRTW